MLAQITAISAQLTSPQEAVGHSTGP